MDRSFQNTTVSTTRPTYRLVFISLIVNVFGLLQYGYPMGVLNLTEVVISSFINESFTSQYNHLPSRTQLAIFYGIANQGLSIGGVFGALSSGNIANTFGRKYTVFFAPSVASIAAAILYGISYATNLFQILLVGRMVSGFGYAMSSISVPVYLNEFCPVQHRGYLNGWHTTISQSWLVLSMALSLPSALGTPNLWPYLYSLPAIPAAVFIILTVFVPDTPQYVYVFQQNPQKAAYIINRYHGAGSDPAELFETYGSAAKTLKSRMGIQEIWQNKGIRKGFMVGLVLLLGNYFTGQTLLNHFSTSMFISAGFSNHIAQYMSMIPASILVILSVIVPFAVERYGRRVLIFISLTLQFIGMSVYIICATLSERASVPVFVSYFSILGASIASSGYALGMGPVVYLTIPELVPVKARATSAKYIVAISMVFVFGLALVYPVADVAIGALCLIPLTTVPQILTFVYLYLKMPETKQKTEMEVYAELLDRSMMSSSDIQDDRHENYGTIET